MGTAALHTTANTGAGGISFQANTTRFVSPGMGGYLTQSAVQYQGQSIWQTAGVWSKLWVRVSVNTRDLGGLIRGRINGADGNQLVTVPATSTGIFQDASNTDAVTAGDILGYTVFSNHSVAATQGFQVPIIQSLFTATAAERSYRLFSGLQTGHTTGFIPMLCASGTYPTAAPYQYHVSGGTMRRASIYIIVNTRNGTSTLTLNINSSDTALAVSIAAGTTGWFSNTSNTATVFDRDKAVWNHVLGGTSGLYNAQHQLCDLVTAAFVGGGTRDGSGIHLKGSGLTAEVDGAGPLSGWHDQETLANEVFVQAEPLVADSWFGTICYIDANGQDDTCEFIARLNGVDGSHKITIPALGTGFFESVGAAISLGATDLISLRRLTNSTGVDALIYFTHSVFGEEVAPPPVLPALGGIYQLVPAKTDDTVYTGFGPTTTRDTAIP